MDQGEYQHVVNDERQRALEQNVFASAKNSQLQIDELRGIANELRVVKWAAVFAAIMLLLLVLK